MLCCVCCGKGGDGKDRVRGGNQITHLVGFPRCIKHNEPGPFEVTLGVPSSLRLDGGQPGGWLEGAVFITSGEAVSIDPSKEEAEGEKREER